MRQMRVRAYIVVRKKRLNRFLKRLNDLFRIEGTNVKPVALPRRGGLLMEKKSG